MEPAERDAWRIADGILEALLDLPPEQREARLAVTAPTPEVRRFVQQLLAAHARPDGPLEHPIPLELLPDAPGTLIGRRLGRWRLLAEIGRGGMAVVYRAVADDGDAAGQLAALKILGIATLASDSRERFVHEQQALLRLRHPYLAQLYDTGVADDGTPWLAMALVEGVRIDQWCEQQRLDMEARVRLLIQVGGALSYAHRNLVIHRDIKPSNVLVDHDGHVRLLDFGIARLADHAGDERTTTALRALTPEYAAPEQFSGALPSTTMDVYGLGALLYRLLTGVAPRSGASDGGEVTQPSRRALAAPAWPADQRQRWSRRLRGDLDAILLKALAARPEARYASVDAFCADLQCWLDGMPVKAQAPGRLYRLGKFIARNRAGAIATALLLLTVGAGMGTTLWQAGKARQQATLAQAAQTRAESALNRSNAIRDFLFELFRNTAPTQPRDQLPTTAELLAAAVDQMPERFKDDPETRAEFLEAIADVYKQRGLPEHLALRRQVLELRARSIEQQPMAYAVAQANLAYSLAKSDPGQSMRLFGLAIDRMRRLAPASRELAHAYRQRAGLQMYLQDGPARLRDSERAWLILERLPDASARERFFAVAGVASGYHQAADYETALHYYDKAVALAEVAFEGTHGWAVTNLANRAGVLSRLARFDEAEAEYRKALAAHASILERPNEVTLASLRELELIKFRQGRYPQALQLRDEWDRMLHANPDADPAGQAKSDLWRAMLLARMQRTGEALVMLHASLPGLEGEGARGRNRLMAYSTLVRIGCDRRALRDALALAAEMLGDNQVYAAEAHGLAGLCALRSGDPRKALVHLDRAGVLDKGLSPGDAAVVAEHLLWRGQALARLDDPAAARVAWSEARRRLRDAGLQAHPLDAELLALAPGSGL